MKCEGEKTYAAKGKCPVCHMNLEPVGEGGRKGMQIPEVRVDLKVSPAPKAKAPLTLDFSLRNTKDDSPVRELEVVHDKVLHLILVSQDLSWFAHEHPEVTKAGELSLKGFTFPQPGNYVLYADFKPKDRKSEVIPTALRIEGDAPKAQALKLDAPGRVKKQGQYGVALTHSPLQSGGATKLAFAVTKKNKVVNDIEPFLGAAGHLVGISEDTTKYIHAHPADHGAHADHAHHGAPPAGQKFGPILEFATTFPKEGLYKLWLQFQHDGKLQTVPFVVSVK